MFDYETANVLRDRTAAGAECPPMPQETYNTHDTNSNKSGNDSSVGGDDCVQLPLHERLEKASREGRGWDLLAGIIEKTRRHEFDGNVNLDNKTSEAKEERQTTSYPHLNQLTINEYKPGDGIGSHVDTPSAFSDGLISISLNSDIVMEFRRVRREADSEKKETDPAGDRKLVYLPPRSLLLMSGPARYEWEHYIVTRMTDTHNGKVLPRGLRVSLTLRTAIDTAKNGAGPLPLVQSTRFPPQWNSGSDGNGNHKTDGTTGPTVDALATPATEREHVHAVYDAIATQWHHTRGKRGVLWPGATQFLTKLPKGSVVADVGCGDGKYFPAIWEAGSYVIGSDISLPLLETAAVTNGTGDSPSGGGRNSDRSDHRRADGDNKDGTKTKDKHGKKRITVEPESRRVSEHRHHLRSRPAVLVADCMNVPLRTDSCDAAICIAVMHHLSTEQRRLRCLEELGRIVKPGGLINVQAWAMEQEESSKRKFASTDVFVPFNAQPKYLDKQGPSASATGPSQGNAGDKSVAEMYAEAYRGAEFNEQKGLVVFQRYCHLYRQGEMEYLASCVPGVDLLESGYESGNHFIILKAKDTETETETVKQA